MKSWKNRAKKLLIIQNWPFFSSTAWLPKRPILGRNRNSKGSPCLLSIYSLVLTLKITSVQTFFAFTYILLLTLVLATPHLASKLEQLELKWTISRKFGENIIFFKASNSHWKIIFEIFCLIFTNFLTFKITHCCFNWLEISWKFTLIQQWQVLQKSNNFFN